MWRGDHLKKDSHDPLLGEEKPGKKNLENVSRFVNQPALCLPSSLPHHVRGREIEILKNISIESYNKKELNNIKNDSTGFFLPEPHKNVVDNISIFLPENYTVLDSISGNLNLDNYRWVLKIHF